MGYSVSGYIVDESHASGIRTQNADTLLRRKDTMERLLLP